MKNITSLFIIILTLVPIICFGCSSDSSVKIDIDEHSNEPEVYSEEGRVIIEIIKELPNEWTWFELQNVEEIENTPAGQQYALDSLQPMLIHTFDGLNIQIHDVDQFVRGGAFGTVALIKGKCTPDKVGITSNLDSQYEIEKYKDVTVWKFDKGFGEEWTTFVGDYLMNGDAEEVKTCLDTILQPNDTLYNNVDFKYFVDHLPDGVLMMMSNGNRQFGESGGKCFWAKNDTTFEYMSLIKFEDETSSANSIDEIKDSIHTLADGERNIHLSIYGKYVITTYEVDANKLYVFSPQ